ncbi:uncharacterized protein LOC107769270 [Nicotiana tabacum]|uniref:Uncharacterized protein LOC107769270 n=1 Tax=Nicotiana tabacum TaxID=4097 RepID=A0A1S3XVJ6_TOBAC|nr:uncharacterized protein LOC104090643 [Nicotiana tomentosiformis]XP_016443963.1 PREDICTED: uncharacterized protein LOC107769270 [Nicotiana tabacum]
MPLLILPAIALSLFSSEAAESERRLFCYFAQLSGQKQTYTCLQVMHHAATYGLPPLSQCFLFNNELYPLQKFCQKLLCTFQIDLLMVVARQLQLFLNSFGKNHPGEVLTICVQVYQFCPT